MEDEKVVISPSNLDRMIIGALDIFNGTLIIVTLGFYRTDWDYRFIKWAVTRKYNKILKAEGERNA